MYSEWINRRPKHFRDFEVKPSRKPLKVLPYDPNPTVSVCNACGLECKAVMMYSCPREDCPTFKKVSM